MRNYFTVVVIALVLSPLLARSQNPYNYFLIRNSVYAQIESRAAPLSLMYDHILWTRNDLYFTYCIGLSAYKERLYVPFGISAFTGQHENHFELTGLANPYIETKGGNLLLYLIATVGYRYQKLYEQGPVLQLAVGPSAFMDPPTPGFYKNIKFEPYIHVSAGFNFK